MILSNVNIDQTLSEYSIILIVLMLEVEVPPKAIPSDKKWYQQIPKSFLSSEIVNILWLIPSTLKKETIVGITYLTLLMYLF